jgi:hypothetical protein
LAPPARTQVWEVSDLAVSEVGLIGPMKGYGEVLAPGDFDGDAVQDLAIGSPFALGHLANVGQVSVRRGGTGRLLDVWWSLQEDDFSNVHLGAALVAGDFDANGRDELAIGAPGHTFLLTDHDIEAGAVRIWGWDGTAWRSLDVLSQLDVGEEPENNDHFGSALAAADFDGDGFDDLAVGVPDEDLETGVDVGLVYLFFGSPAGLRTDNFRVFATGVDGIPGPPVAGDRFGSVLASGDFDGEGIEDLAIGSPDRAVAGEEEAGEILVLYGAGAGAPRTQVLTDADFSGSIAEGGERFGASLATGNFGSGTTVPVYVDLAIGVPGQTHYPGPTPQPAAGKVVIVYGGANGLAPESAAHLTQESVGGAVPEAGDRFGEALAAGLAGGHGPEPVDSWADLAVGAPGEDGESGLVDEGRANLFFGSASGIGGDAPAQDLGQFTGLGIAPPAEGDRFGAAVAISDLDGDGAGDLAIGVPSKEFLHFESGALQVLFGALFADGFESGGDSHWSVSGRRPLD